LEDLRGQGKKKVKGTWEEKNRRENETEIAVLGGKLGQNIQAQRGKSSCKGVGRSGTEKKCSPLEKNRANERGSLLGIGKQSRKGREKKP